MNYRALIFMAAWLAIAAAAGAQTQPQDQAQPQDQTQGSSPRETQGTEPAQPAPGTAQGQATGDPLEQGTAVAQQWLALVDQGDFAGSWDATGKLFQANMPKERWVQTLTAVQKTFGKPVKRDLAGREARTDIEGAPPGEYVLVAFNTDFEQKPGMVETLTMVREEDGQLRVVGYSSNPKEGQAQQGEAQQGQGQQSQAQEPPAAETAQKPPAR